MISIWISCLQRERDSERETLCMHFMWVAKEKAKNKKLKKENERKCDSRGEKDQKMAIKCHSLKMQCDLFIFLLCRFHFLPFPTNFLVLALSLLLLLLLLFALGYWFFFHSLSFFGFWVFYGQKNINDCETFAHCHICYLHCARHLLGNYCIFPFTTTTTATCCTKQIP